MPLEDVTVPRTGESISEGTLNRWLKPDGAYVRVDEPLFELGTDKATQEVVAPVAGVLRVLVPEGRTVEVGTVVARIDTDATAPDTAPRPPALEPKTTAPIPPRAEQPRTGLSPAAARVLAEAGLSPAAVTGTGPGGLVTKTDALTAAAALKPAAAPPAAATENGQTAPRLAASAPPVPPVASASAPAVSASATGAAPARLSTREPMSHVRRRIAARLLESQNTTATLTTFNEADMTAVQDLRARYNDRFEKKHGVRLGFMSVFVKAAVEALKAFPLLNARIDGTDIVHQHFYDIGVAVSTDKGLMVPVVRDADRLGFADIEKKIAELAQKARDGRITVGDLEGGTFTITNGGIFGSMMSTPILNPPQVGILGMHSIIRRPVVVNDQVVIRPMMYLALSYDHRLIDGREAVQFLVRIKECVENPERMLLDV